MKWRVSFRLVGWVSFALVVTAFPWDLRPQGKRTELTS